MLIIFAILWFMALMGLIIGLNYPNLVLWGSKPKNEARVLKTYGIALIVFFLLFGMSLEYLGDIEKQENYISQEVIHKEESINTQEGLVSDQEVEEKSEPEESTLIVQEQNEINDFTINQSNELLEVHFIDVGQGDATLFITPKGKTILKDAGDGNQGEKVVSYIKDQGVEKIDLLIASHPHADHIGGMAAVIQAFEIGEIYMPEVTANTRTFENLLLAIQEKNLTIKPAKAGVEFNLDPRITAQLIAPNNTVYNNLNDYSAVLRVDYGEVSFLITGDVEAQSEREMINSGYPLQVDVLRVSHHGSNSSSIPEFLEVATPTYGVISVGKGNRYGHPHQELLQRLQEYGLTVYRTDEVGTIVASTDGRDITFAQSPSLVGEVTRKDKEESSLLDVKDWLMKVVVDKVLN